MKTTLLAIVMLAASFAYATPPQLGDYGAEYPVWSASDPFAIAVATNTAALLTLETAARKAEDSGLSNYVDTVVAGVTASSLGALTNAVRLMSADGTYFQTVENGTGTVWNILDKISLSNPFGIDIENLFDVMPVSTFPFRLSYAGGEYVGEFSNGYAVVRNTADPSRWISTGTSYPYTLVAAEGLAVGTATVTAAAYTNVYATFATAAELAAINATLGGRITAVEAMALTPAQVIGIVNPYQTTVYGSTSITNDAGYGAFLTTNPATAKTRSIAATSNGQVVASYRYNITNRTDSTYVLSYHFFCSQDEKQLTPVASLVSASGVTLASYTMPTVTYMSGGSTTNVVTSFSLSQATSSWVNVSFVCASDGGGAYGIRTGGAYPMALTVPIIPTAYATQGQIDGKVAITNGTAYNLALTGTVSLNGSTISNWPSGGGGVSAAQWLYYDTATNATGKTSYQIYTNALGGALTNFFISSLVPATGQTNVFFEGSCDGCLRWGAALPTPRFGIGASGAATNVVHDYLTGLDWARKADNATNSWSGAFAFISTNLNAESYGGFNDWRMPNLSELTSLVNRQYENPCISGISGLTRGGSGDPFHGLQNVDYWSSTTRMGLTNYVITFSVGAGFYSSAPKQANLRFLAVRGGVPAN